MNGLQRAWLQRPPRERLVFAALAAFVLLVVVAVFVWLPLERARHRTAAQLPALRASLAALERDALEVKRLRAMPTTTAATGAPREPLASLATNAGGLAGARITVLDERRVRVAGDDLAYGALLE